MIQKPLVIHPDSRIIYVVEALDKTGEVSQRLIQYADLIQAPEQVHTYALSPFALWTAKAKGITSEELINFLEDNAQNSIPEKLKQEIRRDMDHFGSLTFFIKEEFLVLKAETVELIQEIKGLDRIRGKVIPTEEHDTLMFHLRYRREIKKVLYEHNLFVKDALYKWGDELDITVIPQTLHKYQLSAINHYLNYHHQAGGGGTIIMPPNSGKIIVGIKIMEVLKTSTLIIVEDKYKVEKWKKEILENTDLTEHSISIFDSNVVELRPVTIGTYDSLCDFVDELQGFGFVIYDDAHVFPTPKHEITIDIPSTNKLALASTLARYDGNGNLVLALIGPKWYEVLYRTLVHQKIQVPVICIEVKIPLPEEERQHYLNRDRLKKVNADSLNSNKVEVVHILLKKEVTKRLLLVSYFQEVIAHFRNRFELDILDSQLNEEERLNIINAFNEQKIDKLLTASKLIEHMPLHMVETMIAVSHQQGSEREEYLRLGKLLPADFGKEKAVLYSLVSENTEEERYYSKRRRKLINQGFHYKIKTFKELMERGEFFEP
jgi:DNA excision repair protein ERCC-3